MAAPGFTCGARRGRAHRTRCCALLPIGRTAFPGRAPHPDEAMTQEHFQENPGGRCDRHHDGPWRHLRAEHRRRQCRQQRVRPGTGRPTAERRPGTMGGATAGMNGANGANGMNGTIEGCANRASTRRSQPPTGLPSAGRCQQGIDRLGRPGRLRQPAGRLRQALRRWTESQERRRLTPAECAARRMAGPASRDPLWPGSRQEDACVPSGRSSMRNTRRD